MNTDSPQHASDQHEPGGIPASFKLSARPARNGSDPLPESLHKLAGRLPAESALPKIIEFRNVNKVFNPGTPREFKALDQINFTIADLPGRGEFIAIVGPSGCGKSTMLNLLAGFHDTFPPTSGEILVHGKPITGPGKDRGMIFQKYSSFPQLTVLRNVGLGLRLNRKENGLSDKQIDEMAMQWIEKVGLGGHQNKYPRQLSGGQQQRVAIARTLILKPRIVLMDEPFSALDEPTRIEMQRLIVDLWVEVEATVLIVTHSLVEAAYLGDRVWIFSPSPGHIALEDRDVPPPIPGESPMIMQKTPEFLAIVDRIAQQFMEIEKGHK
ncbi:MAG: ABC transporter ATP-binding protein [Candidatus Sumerlaeota bacterium]|nr:ABC transporter ATP-binding protein [Candidatus Sumerlaeota bacterium]